MKERRFAIGRVTIAPVRSSHADSAEMVTQLLFGEAVEILEIRQEWVKIRICHDDYLGWIDRKQLLSLSDETIKQIRLPKIYQQNQTLTLNTPWGKQNVVQGTPVLSFEKNFQLDEFQFSWKNRFPRKESLSLSRILSAYYNAPYLWGGRTPFGVDCSGFTQTVFHQLGINLKRDAAQQALQGEKVMFYQRNVGDLAFFRAKDSEKIIHVGIVLPLGKIMHIHGRGRTDTLNEYGIFNEEEQYHSHQLYIIKRYRNFKI